MNPVTRAAVACLLVCVVSSAAAGSTSPGHPGLPPIRPLPGDGSAGLTVALTLPATTMWLDMMPGIGPEPREHGSILAVFTLANRTGQPLALRRADLPDAAPLVLFVLRDSENRVVWQSYAAGPDEPVSSRVRRATLPTGRKWRAVARVPLAPEGVPLQPGRYSLEAALQTRADYSARASFEVGYAY